MICRSKGRDDHVRCFFALRRGVRTTGGSIMDVPGGGGTGGPTFGGHLPSFALRVFPFEEEGGKAAALSVVTLGVIGGVSFGLKLTNEKV
ncbi:hypothetical protein PVC01_020011500 [Plasmodium vivax]|uniref:(malaria parasite P. vivax) hypothetical protein n=1 Tax=Plasmodium vivax TaxID=5855 RepID=A0A1G4H6V5_PLAVI|nr:unnamed protein product [Plasmodium vivax]SCO70610.1 hypothetical protein PVC01_020011500 [Plasmodium vivax]